MTRQATLILAIILSAIPIIAFILSKNADSKDSTPSNLVLWVWERPENLYFLTGEAITYAYLSGTATATDNGWVFKPRQQPLRVDKDAPKISVIRIEDKTQLTSLTSLPLTEITDFILTLCNPSSQSAGCQLDFDALEGQLDYYREFLVKLRAGLDEKTPLSITALLSWCTTNEKWLSSLPVDEIVPMFFELGKEGSIYWSKIDSESLLLPPICQRSIGISHENKWPHESYFKNKKIYVFNYQLWDKRNWTIMISKLNEMLM
jgi:hypothetical protein